MSFKVKPAGKSWGGPSSLRGGVGCDSDLHPPAERISPGKANLNSERLCCAIRIFHEFSLLVVLTSAASRSNTMEETTVGLPHHFPRITILKALKSSKPPLKPVWGCHAQCPSSK